MSEHRGGPETVYECLEVWGKIIGGWAFIAAIGLTLFATIRLDRLEDRVKTLEAERQSIRETEGASELPKRP